MRLGLRYTLALMYTLSTHSAELTKQEVPATITSEGKHSLRQDVYNKLLAISGTLQNDNAEHSTPHAVYFPDTQDPYYEIGHDTQRLQHITDYISADNTHAYLDTLSLVQLIDLYQNADYWSLDTPILDNLLIYIVGKLQNKDVLNDIFSTRKTLDTFLNACNSQTKATLAHTLLPYVGNFFWPSVTKPHQTLTGHADWISSVAVDIDGTLFSGSEDYTIRVWKKDAQGTYHCVQILTGHTDSINTAAVHTDGTLFSGSNDYTICVWKKDVQGAYHCVQTLTDHTDSIRTVAIHSNGTLFSASEDCTIRIWKKDAQGTYHCVQILRSDTADSIRTLTVDTDGSLFSGSHDFTIRVWKPNAQGTYYCVQNLTGHTHWINSVAVHTDGTLLSGSYDDTIRVWKKDAQGTYHCVQILRSDADDSIRTVAVHIDGTLFSGSEDYTIRVWKKDAQGTYHCVQTLTGHTDSIKTVAVHTDGTLFSGSDDESIRIWKAPIVPLSLEQCLTVSYLYHQHQNNNKQQLLHVSPQAHNFYNTLPHSIKNIIIPWYNPTPL